MDAQKENELSPPEASRQPLHPLVAKTFRQLRKLKEKDPSSRVSIWGEGFLDVWVSPSSFDRAEHLMDSFLHKLESRGYKVISKKHGWKNKWLSLIVAHDQEITLELREDAKQVRHALSDEEKTEKRKWGTSWVRKYDYPSIGRFRLQIAKDEYLPWIRKQWVDSNHRKVEDLLDKALEAVSKIAAAQQARADELEQERKAAAEAARKRHEEEQRQKQMEKELSILLDQVTRWRNANQIREYASAVKDMFLQQNAEMGPESKAAKWLEWAHGHADRIDPLISPEGAETGN